MVSPGVNGILNKLLDHRGRPLNHFASGYLVSDRIGKKMNQVGHSLIIEGS